MAISNTQNDERLATDIAASVNYIPESILCVPLFYDDRIIGVLELLDKIDAPSFSMNDMHNLGLFAGIASIAIVQSQAYKDEQSILTGLLRVYCQEHKAEEKKQIYDESQTFVNWLNQGDTLNSKSREMARLVQDLILSGEQECELCLNILQSVSTYTRQQTVSYL
jgi:transcriptional regulator with GAF, ATPase, and Fis domain